MTKPIANAPWWDVLIQIAPLPATSGPCRRTTGWCHEKFEFADRHPQHVGPGLETRISSLCIRQNMGGHINVRSRIFAALVVIAAMAPPQADAKGCIKGAIVGAIAGHMVGHGKLGAAAGCIVGHHEANKPGPVQEGQPVNPPR